MGRRILFASLLLAFVGYASGVNRSLDQASSRFEQQTASVPAALRIEFRMRAAQALMERHPGLASRFVNLAVQEIRSGKDWQLEKAVLQTFAVVAPADGVAILPYLAPPQIASITGALARANRTHEALALYRQALADGDLQASNGYALLVKLVKENPPEAGKLFREMLAAAHFDTLEPDDSYSILDCARIVAPVASHLAVEACERIAAAASAPDYGAKAKTAITGTFQVGAATVTTANSRDTLLVVSGSRLREWAPAHFEERKALFERWNLVGPLSVKSHSSRRLDAAPAKKDELDEAAVSKQMGQLHGLPTDADRARLVIQIARDIRALPSGGMRVSMFSSLANLSTEGDLGKEALSAVADSLAQALQDSPASTCDPYLELASLVRFEHLPAPKSGPLLDSAESLLALQELLHQEAGFKLTGLDGKIYSLPALRGHVVLLNFWATWCPPCRKEMPDLEKLYRKFRSKGLIVLAVSDEDRETVASFEEKENYTFPILLDPDRKANTSFAVEGIPKSFLFDRDGKLVSQAIDMRTEAQFLEMLKAAGI